MKLDLPRAIRSTIAVLAATLAVGSTARANSVTSTFQWNVSSSSSWVDNAGNIVVVSGQTIRKLRPDNTVLWTVTLTSNDGFDFSHHLVFDSTNNLFVDGFVDNRSAPSAITVVKISSSGSILWNNKYIVGPVNSSEHMSEGPMLLSPNGSLYVLGHSGFASTNNHPAELIRINPSTGGQVNARNLTDSFDNTPGMGDSALGGDNLGNVYYGSPAGLFSFTSDLTERWPETTFTNPVRAIVVDRLNDIFVTGTMPTGGSNWAMYVARINSSNGSAPWTQIFASVSKPFPYPAPLFGSPQDDRTYGGNVIALDSHSQIYAAGFGADGTGWNGGLMVKYSQGGQLWWTHPFGVNNANGTCLAMALDEKDNAYLSGQQGDVNSPQAALITLVGPDGTTFWGTTYGSPFEQVTQVGVDKRGAAYWQDSATGTTRKYQTSGRIVTADATPSGTGNTKVLMDTFDHNNVLLENFTATDVLTGSVSWNQSVYGKSDRDISGGPDGRVRILQYRDYDGSNSAAATVVIRNDAGSQTNSTSFNVVAGLRALKIATGSDNKSYVLLRSSLNSAATVWRLSASGGMELNVSFPPLNDRDPVAIAVDGTSIVYLIWQGPGGTIYPWRLDTNLNVTNQTASLNGMGYVVMGADVGADHNLRILGAGIGLSGSPIVWSLNNTGGLVTSQVQGPFGGWLAQDLSVGADNRSHLIWNDIVFDEYQYTATNASLMNTVLEAFSEPAP